jgi:hypothetical protein
MKLHRHFEFGPASQDPFSFFQIQLALDTVKRVGPIECRLTFLRYRYKLEEEHRAERHRRHSIIAGGKKEFRLV